MYLSETSAAPRIQDRAVNVESDYNYGSRVGVWRIFRLFNEKCMKYTLHAVGRAVEENPAVVVSSVENGHEVASHGYRYVFH
jgi:peptidoglycan/xylan/chitin deacetylase (PgdA/CDA1 family)